MAGWFDILRKTLGWPSSPPVVEVITDEKPYVETWSSVIIQTESYMPYDKVTKIQAAPESSVSPWKVK